MKLIDYPYIIVRIQCAFCAHAKNYRLARLAARFGVDVGTDELLEKVDS